MDFIKKEVEKNHFKGSYRYHIGQYLPEWHPWERYQDFFIGQPRTNACREIFAIELPWLTEVFGAICSVKVVHKKASRLEIDFDDLYQVVLEHESGVLGNLIVEVISPSTVRKLEILGEGFYIEWKGSPETLKCYRPDTKKIEEVYLYQDVEHTEGYSSFVVENAYYDELVNFIECVEKRVCQNILLNRLRRFWRGSTESRNRMKLCFVGLDSIASLHIKNIGTILSGQEWSLDVLRSGNGRALTKEQKKRIRHVYESADDIQENYDAVFITNPTRLQYQTQRRWEKEILLKKMRL